MIAPIDFNDRMLSLGLARVSEAAAHAAAALIGRGDAAAANRAAVEAMREQLNMLDIDGTVVIGEGGRDEAPMLYLGEKVGNGKGPAVDIALDALQGARLTARDMPNAMTVIAMAPAGTLLHAPDIGMEKLAIGPGYAPDLIGLEMSPEERVLTLASARGVRAGDITCCVLDRPQNAGLIGALRETGAAVRLMADGDLAGVIDCAEPVLTGIDVYMGSGRAPETVLAAAALKCMGGQVWARFVPDAGLAEPGRIYRRDDLASSDVIFAATGVTSGSILRGVRRAPHFIETETILMRSKTGSLRRMIYRNPVRPA
ncbi:fructose-bisphosphatase class II family protein [Sinirhodobacter populi]|uniref:Fructose-1,6-bisphosphatase n=1 Tax=Paenirhodobacter populi TaxID=2306993 RepID=A0A443KJ32_9RHOB|nr:fructose-bisphosphatase class II family protein [Sinirhodobacter populi]RWR32769.1 fructose-bisphosphatase class II family protein [Sinirhodobacter populi]